MYFCGWKAARASASRASGRHPVQSCFMDYFHSLTLFPSSSPQIINSVVLLILLSALTDPDQYHLTSAELGGEFEFMDDASKYGLSEHEHSLLQNLGSCLITSVVIVI